MDVGVDKLYIDIQSSADSATRPIDNLIQAFGRLDNMVNRMSFNSFVVQTKQLGRKAGGSAMTAIDGIQQAIERIDTTRAISHIERMNNALRVANAATFTFQMRQVESSVNHAADTFESAVTRMGSSVAKLNGIKATSGTDNISRNLEKFASFATRMSNVNVGNLDGRLQTFADAIYFFFADMNAVIDGGMIDRMSQVSMALSRFATMANSMGRMNLGNVGNNMQQYAQQIMDFAANLGSVDESTITKTDNLRKIINSLANIATKMASINTNGAAGFLSSMGTAITSFGTAMSGFNDDSVKRLDDIGKHMSKFASLGKIMSDVNPANLTASMSTLAQKVTEFSASMSSIDDSSAEKLKNIGSSMSVFGKFASIAFAVNPAVFSTNMGLLAYETERFVRTIANIPDDVANKFIQIGNALNNIATNIGKVKSGATVFDNIRSNTTQAASGLNLLEKAILSVAGNLKKLHIGNAFGGGLVKRFSAMTFNRLFRQMAMTFISGMTNSLNEFYSYSKQNNGDFAKNMDMLATSFAGVNNAIAAASAQLLNSLAPALQFVLDLIIKVINGFQQLVAALSGKGYWTDMRTGAA